MKAIQLLLTLTIFSTAASAAPRPPNPRDPRTDPRCRIEIHSARVTGVSTRMMEQTRGWRALLALPIRNYISTDLLCLTDRGALYSLNTYAVTKVNSCTERYDFCHSVVHLSNDSKRILEDDGKTTCWFEEEDMCGRGSDY